MLDMLDAIPNASAVKPSRRSILTGISSALIVGLAPHNALSQSPRPSLASAYLRIDTTGKLTVLIGQCEMGQGITTGLSMLVADELGADWSQVSFAFVTQRPEYWHPIIYREEQITGGSMSIMAFGTPLRTAAAAAREMLISAASQAWSVPRDHISIRNGFIIASGGRQAGIGEMVSAASMLTPPIEPRLKARAELQLVGRPTKRLDAPDQVSGKTVYGLDVSVPGMLFAAVRQARVLGTDVATFDAVEALRMTGVVGVHRIPNGIAVVAQSYWHAAQALDAIKLTFTSSTNDKTTSASVQADLQAAFAKTSIEAAKNGDVDAILSTSALSADYSVPFLAHGTLEPMNATASVTGDRVELWVPTQAPTLDEIAVAAAMGIDRKNVKINMTHAGGGFGRRGFSEYAVQAAVLSRAVGRPVQVLWSRSEDMKLDYLRPAFAAHLRGLLDTARDTISLDMSVAGPGIWKVNRPPVVEFFKGVDLLAVEGLNSFKYASSASRVRHHMTDPVTKIGYWRSIGYSHNLFFLESFLDELCHANSVDPMEMRIKLLKSDPRAVAVLEMARDRSAWREQLPRGRAKGVGYFQSDRYQCRVAQVADLEVINRTLKIHRLTCIADIGQAVNPLSIEAQLQGSIVFALSAALFGEINLVNGAVVESSFRDYRVARLKDCPPIDIHIVQGGDKPGGVGEIGVPAVAPAITNALFRASGNRVRSLPITKAGFAI
jgi:isoquinoline 1-oxidoreductase subunit beta